MGTDSKDRDLQRSGAPGIHRLEGGKDFGFAEFDFERNLGLPGETFSRKMDVKIANIDLTRGFMSDYQLLYSLT